MSTAPGTGDTNRSNHTGATIPLHELGAASFVTMIPTLVDIYRCAMQPPDYQLIGRREIMERHTTIPGFHAVAAAGPTSPDAAPRIVGFAYGFPGRPGQWWFDTVTAALRDRDAAARSSLREPFEIAEFHVHPDWQGQGVGRRLLERLTAVRSERTAVLSTHSGDSRARKLYRAYGFTDILTDFYFPGNPDQPFTIMTTWLPLPELQPHPDAGTPPASRLTG
ncbi:GNAT family N-acetyltransferase [Lipingzhangella sp. LS1_29]|uniref:GNAT family N-acetyltransferase n=1 Tax=Lipingzhangella rawalii TaxID=2055835 RepID=A0ABU2H2F5_9ACTN|nr:GNAT family N-acetyltransferase [Lipingzhangella rawalii]MDS1269478.1 GNAT family N-acetyltransferase [Lipingzhangella rawalii]